MKNNNKYYYKLPKANNTQNHGSAIESVNYNWLIVEDAKIR